MSLVNVSLRLWSLNMAYMIIVWLKKMWVDFAFANTTQVFFFFFFCFCFLLFFGVFFFFLFFCLFVLFFFLFFLFFFLFFLFVCCFFFQQKEKMCFFVVVVFFLFFFFFRKKKMWTRYYTYKNSVNILITDEFVELTMLWTTGPWSGTLSFLHVFSSCLACALVTTPAEKCDISRRLEPSVLPITKSYKMSFIHNASVLPLQMGSRHW